MKRKDLTKTYNDEIKFKKPFGLHGFIHKYFSVVRGELQLKVLITAITVFLRLSHYRQVIQSDFSLT